MTILSKVKVTELDFEQNRENLKTHLQSKPEFNSFNFEGSNMAQVLNLLALNNNYMAMTANFNGNEAFINSSQLRSSVVSNAAPLGYIPRSKTSPLAIVDIIVTPPDVGSAPSSLTLERGKKLSTIVNNQNYVFSVMEVEESTLVNGVYTFSNVEIREGVLVTNTFTVSNGNRKFTIPNSNIDTKTLKVTVQNSDVDFESREFKYAHDENILKVTDESLIYYLNEVDEEKFEIEFGDGVLGKLLDDGNIVILEYVSTKGDEANSANEFDMTNTINDFSDISVTTIAQASGGADRDEVDTIKFLAPRKFESQGNIVSPSDYTTAIFEYYKDAESVISWSGDENDPPYYGKNFSAVKPFSGDVLPNAIKDYIVETILKPRRVSGITPVIVDPEYTYITINSIVEYDTTKTTFTSKQLREAVSNVIDIYSTATLEKFFGNFKYSNLSALIDVAENSIISNYMTLVARKKISPTLGKDTKYTINFKNELTKGSIKSTYFSVVDAIGIEKSEEIYYLRDDSKGNIHVSYVENDITRNLIENIGTVDYEKGMIQINSLNIISIPDIQLEISTSIYKNDINAVRNEILRIDTKNITLLKSTNAK